MVKHFLSAEKIYKRRWFIIKEKKYLTCKIDRVFKDIFLDSKDTSLLKGLLESILKLEIKSISIKNSEVWEGNKNYRRKYLDAIIDTNQGIINIEANSATKNYIRVRNFAYLAKIYANNTLRGKRYDTKTKFIQINFTYELKDKEYFRVYSIQDKKNKNYTNNFIIYE